jgi:N-acetylglucosaminyldiphosphoundecaprenol N-acetyl-beta-D-mannosaminyltransferase
VRDNVNGTDLFPLLCDSLAKNGHSLYLLGAKPGVAAAVALWAQKNYPGLIIAGTQHGYFKPEENEQIVSTIRASKADVVLVAFGAPRQEAWINQNMTASGASVLMGVGGLFDYFSGMIPRAPLWMRKTGLEWLFRLLQEPTRLWRRYLIGNGVFLFRISLFWLHRVINNALHHRKRP